MEGMSDSLLNFLQHLREFGLVFQRKVCIPRYVASRKETGWSVALAFKKEWGLRW